MQGEPGVGIKGERGDAGPPGTKVSDSCSPVITNNNQWKLHVCRGLRPGHDAVTSVCFHHRDQMASKVHLGLQG